MLSVLDLVDSQHRQATAAVRRQISIEFAAMSEVSRACNSIFGLIDRDDHYQREVPRIVWRLKTTLLQTLLPFDDDRLELRQMTLRLSRLAEGLPAIADPTQIICRIVDTLLASSRNPKLERLSALLLEAQKVSATGILVGLQGSLGWPADLDASNDLGLQGVRLLRSRRDLHGQIFDTILIPGSLRFVARPFINEALYGGRAAEVVIAAYRGERVFIPAKLELPRDLTFDSTRRARRQAPTIEEEVVVDGQLDEWVHETFWDGIRQQHVDVSPTSDRDVLVNARFVLFADASGAFLPEDRTVIEISDLVDRGEQLSSDEDRMPRKVVDDLEENDLVLLRLSGSGDYLEEVADTLMAMDGLPDLRAEATEWKSILYVALKRHGEGIVARAARERGAKLRSPSYLWVWAGDAVIAPQSYETFRFLIDAISSLDDLGLAGGQEEYARLKWKQMEQVKDYHRRAGGEIRAALLKRVKSLIGEHQKIEAVASIDLPGVQSGQVGLLRVSAVDSRSIRVPLSRLFHVQPVKV